MDYLDGFLASERGRTLIQRCKDSHAVQGLIVELDGWWLYALSQSLQGVGPSFKYYHKLPELIFFDSSAANAMAGPPRLEVKSPLPRIDPVLLEKFKPDGWINSRVENEFRDPGNPVQARVCLYPRWENREGASLPELDELNVNYFFEVRPIPQLAALPGTKLNPLVGGGGIGVRNSGPGTLGGLVRDLGGISYGVTCAHVASGNAIVEHPARTDARSWSRIGQVAQSQTPTSYPPKLAMTEANQAGNANEVDVALIQLDPTMVASLAVDQLGPIAAIYPKGNIQQWQATTFAGRTSNIRNVEFRGRVPYYNIPDGTGRGTFCFKDLYQIQWSPAQGGCGPPIQAGDSGAWLCVNDPAGLSWAAMAVAWDAQIGFAITASAIENWWQNLGLSLSPA